MKHSDKRPVLRSSAFLFAVLIFLISVFSVTVPVYGAEGLPFRDVKSGSWYYGAVKYVYEKGIMNGVSSSKFDPNGTVTRAMFVTMLGRVSGAEKTTSTPFSDVDFKKGGWYAGYVGWASENGIVDGYPDGTFRPNGYLTREQMTAVILRFLDYKNVVPTRDAEPLPYFTDDGKVSKWARGYVDEMRLIGLVKGKTGGYFDPAGKLTRAEAATVMMRLVTMTDYLELGDPISPDYTVDGGSFALMGAWDLYYGGTALDSSYPGVRVVDDGEIPYLAADGDDVMFLLGASGDRTQDGNTSFGKADNPNPLLKDNYFEVDMRVARIDPEEYPVLRFAYRTSNGEKVTFGLFVDYYGFAVNDWEATEYVDFDEQDETVPGGWKYGVVDVSRFADSFDTAFQVCPCFMSEDDVELLYFAAFRNAEDAQNFDVTDMKDRLSRYGGEIVTVTESSENDVASALGETGARAEAIINCDRDVDPATIRGTCYYISNKGDDSNSGTSPDSPWKSFNNLYKVFVTDAQTIAVSLLKPGDAVFLERGSVFDRNRYGEFDCLDISEGVTYAAYGTGPKPRVTARFITDEPAGRWVPSGYDKVWKLDYEIHDYPGSIVFRKSDGTELWGVFVFLENYNDPYSGEPTRYYGTVSNGEETFESGRVPFTDPGCLKHNLEYFCDKEHGELFVYYDAGNPGEVFEEIDISRDAVAIDDKNEYFSNYMTRIDNISVCYAGVCGINTWEADDLYITNCEFAWIGGAYQNEEVRYGNAVSNWGDCDGVFVTDCYFRDIYDAAISTQGSFGIMRNYYSSGCVLERCGLNYEFFNGGAVTEQCAHSEMTNVIISDNYVINSGFGACDIRTDRRGAFFIASYQNYTNTTYSNMIYERNVNIFSGEYAVFGEKMALGKTEGAVTRDNIYYIDPDEAFYGKLIYNLLDRVGSETALFPYTSRYLTYLGSIGIEEGSTFFSAKNPDDAGRRQ